MRKIMAIRTPTFECISRYVCIDEFETYSIENPYYYCGIEVYKDSDKHLSVAPHLRFASLWEETYIPSSGAVCRSRSDVFEKPDITMYCVLSNALKEKGLVFNKKKGQIEKRIKG